MLAITNPAPFRIVLASLILLYPWSSLRISRQWLEVSTYQAILRKLLLLLAAILIYPFINESGVITRFAIG